MDRRARAEEALQRHLQARLDLVAGFHLRVNDLDAAQSLVNEGLALTQEDGTLKYWRGRFLQRAAMIAGAEGR